MSVVDVTMRQCCRGLKRRDLHVTGSFIIKEILEHVVSDSLRDKEKVNNAW